MSACPGTRNYHQQGQDRGGQEGKPKHTVRFSFLKTRELNECLLKTGHLGRPGLANLIMS